MHRISHPLLAFEDRQQDLIREAVDVAIRLGRLVDSSATAKADCENSPDHRCGTEVSRACRFAGDAGGSHEHRIIGGSAAAVPSAWASDRGSERVSVGQPHWSTNDRPISLAVFIGITSTSEWACHSELEAGSLIRLFTEFQLFRCTPIFQWTCHASTERQLVDRIWSRSFSSTPIDPLPKQAAVSETARLKSLS